MEAISCFPTVVHLNTASFASPLASCITQRPISKQTAPSQIASMTTPSTQNTSSTTAGKQEAARQWIQKRLRKLPSIQPSSDGDGGLRERLSAKRPQTAPSNAITEQTSGDVPDVPPIPITFRRPVHTPSIQPPNRPPRPDSGVIRDVNAWLDASVNTPSPPLMGGLSYWRSGSVTDGRQSRGVQHAIPIVQERQQDRPATSQSHHLKSFRRRAKKIQVQMPMLTRSRSHRLALRRRANRRSNSMPIFAVPYEETQQAAPPRMVGRTKSYLVPTLRTVTVRPPAELNAGFLLGEPRLEQPRHRFDSPFSATASEADGTTERRLQTIFGIGIRTTRSAESTRPSTAAAHLTRENSLGDLSDAPTYLSGPPPPSYRSRPESMLSTSSFGCIDGMNPAQRQISQQRAAEQRGMKGKLKRFAQNFVV